MYNINPENDSRIFKVQTGGDLRRGNQRLLTWRGLKAASIDQVIKQIEKNIGIVPPVFSHFDESTGSFYRARVGISISDENKLSSFLSPPPEYVGEGRANLVAIPVLYASNHIPTAVEEVQAEEGDKVWTIELGVKPGDTIFAKNFLVPPGTIDERPHPERVRLQKFAHDVASGVYPKWKCENSAKELLDAMNIIAEIFTLGDYALSSKVAYASMYSGDNAKIGALVYSSDKNRRVVNLAINPAAAGQRINIVGLIRWRYQRYGDGLHLMPEAKGVRDPNDNTRVIWADKFQNEELDLLIDKFGTPGGGAIYRTSFSDGDQPSTLIFDGSSPEYLNRFVEQKALILTAKAKV